jgi:hypothetical protein
MPYSSLKPGKGFGQRKQMARGKRPKRNYAKRLGTAKPRPGSLRELKATLETLNARYVKLRDGQQCGQCAADGVPNQGILDAGHLYPKSVFRATKFRVEAIYAQCRFHNMLHCSRPEYFLMWFQKEHGQERLEDVHALAVSDWRPDREWVLSEIALRESQIEELELLAVA